MIPDRTGEVWWLYENLYVIVGPPMWLMHRDVSHHPCLNLETGEMAWAHETPSFTWQSGVNRRTRIA